MKGEERVCHVTEADMPGANALDVSEEVSSCEAAIWHGVLPLCAAAFYGLALRRGRGSSAKQGHLVDALALRGDEGRGTLRKARGRCERSVIPGSPNGATHPGLDPGYHDLNS